MSILVTGAQGFIGKNLIAELRNRNFSNILEYDKDTDPNLLPSYCRQAKIVFHLAGVNRPKEASEFVEGNVDFTELLLSKLDECDNYCPIVVTSSVQAELDNPYGLSKKASEVLLQKYKQKTGARVVLFRLPNVFGKWCRPFYNNVIATFCHQITRDLPITINDGSTIISLAYIDDVVNELILAMEATSSPSDEYQKIPKTFTRSLQEIAIMIREFSENRKDMNVSDMADEFTFKLYSTFLSYLPTDRFSYFPKTHENSKGSFTEIIRTLDRGQLSVNISRPDVTKGNHWHHTKCEKFIVVSGEGVIKFRKLNHKEVIEYRVSGETIEIVDIPPGYTHSIQNIGSSDLVTIMWASECFDTNNPDTYYLEVIK
jgi:UDP-2-acetamido-2,6-beta-L-arabino-hexul-4-ose reductase